jgi:glucosamine 6-phosphate synthetase-like amidotransferase/phosphosugar isomerase protein
VIGNKAKRRMAEIDALAETFTRLLLLSEHCGPHATGVAWVKRDGTMQVAKEPLPAHAFVQSGAFIDWLMGVDRQVTYLIGHTRWPSRGSVRNAAENHPISIPPILLTHNGTIIDHARHFRRLGLPRTTQVDSELLARLAQHHTGQDSIQIEDFLAGLAPLEGSMSAALVATSHPEQIVLLKGNMPLDVRLHRRQRIWLYASVPRILNAALGDDAGWAAMPMAPGDALVINTASIDASRRLQFTFQGMARLAAWHRFTGA